MSTYIQMTDLHIDNSDTELKHLDPRRNTELVLRTISKNKVERVIITGDIAESNSGNIWFISSINNHNIVYDLVMGNHDDNKYYQTEIFKSNKSYKAFEQDNFLNIFLDSSRSIIDESQLIWLNETISRTNLDIIVFIHHPILDCGNSVMDIKYPLLGRTNIIRMLVESGKRVHIFCGHYHTDFTTVFKNIIQYVTPSTLYQLKMHSEKLEIESERIGYRIININGTVIETEVKYLK